jgi:hypothetical protein
VQLQHHHQCLLLLLRSYGSDSFQNFNSSFLSSPWAVIEAVLPTQPPLIVTAFVSPAVAEAGFGCRGRARLQVAVGSAQAPLPSRTLGILSCANFSTAGSSSSGPPPWCFCSSHERETMDLTSGFDRFCLCWWMDLTVDPLSHVVCPMDFVTAAARPPCAPRATAELTRWIHGG